MKLTDPTPTYCNDLTNFEYEARYNRKRKFFEYAGIWMEKLVKPLYFWRVLAIWNHSEAVRHLKRGPGAR